MTLGKKNTTRMENYCKACRFCYNRGEHKGKLECEVSENMKLKGKCTSYEFDGGYKFNN